MQRLFVKFESGNFSLKNESRGRPEENSIDNSVLREIIANNPIQTVTEIVFQLKVSFDNYLRFNSNGE